MVTFAPTGLLRTILVIAVLIYLFRMYMRYQAQRDATKEQRQSRRNEGRVTVEPKGPRPRPGDDTGEYVDYEEVD